MVLAALVAPTWREASLLTWLGGLCGAISMRLPRPARRSSSVREYHPHDKRPLAHRPLDTRCRAQISVKPYFLNLLSPVPSGVLLSSRSSASSSKSSASVGSLPALAADLPHACRKSMAHGRGQTRVCVDLKHRNRLPPSRCGLSPALSGRHAITGNSNPRFKRMRSSCPPGRYC
jgi:hypothetical protein